MSESGEFSSAPSATDQTNVTGLRSEKAYYLRYFRLLVCAWTFVIGMLFVSNKFLHDSSIDKLAIENARSIFHKDILYRRWASGHGGVYVPVTQKTQPNPFLNVPEREITTPSGRLLTLVNPAYMTRQVFELQEAQMDIRGHITSLIPLRPENTPDPWESSALKQFESGAKEVVTKETTSPRPMLRLMRPLFVEESCLKCHENQGYKVGEVRGGISVSIPLDHYITPDFTRMLIIGHGGLWVVGLIGLFAGYFHLKRHMAEFN